MAGQQTTQTRDETYDLISVLYHALEGADTYAKYRHDAERSGDTELAAFLSEVLNLNKDIAQRAKRLLASRLITTEKAAPVEEQEPAQH